MKPLQKENYRPVSLLPHVSKVFERIIHKQITNYMTDKLAHSKTGFRKSLTKKLYFINQLLNPSLPTVLQFGCFALDNQTT